MKNKLISDSHPQINNYYLSLHVTFSLFGYWKKKHQAANKKIMAKENKKKGCFFQKR